MYTETAPSTETDQYSPVHCTLGHTCTDPDTETGPYTETDPYTQTPVHCRDTSAKVENVIFDDFL